ncbi:unnamed protein product [Mytilus coruscus]|uniref:Mutator-like transposase domain-containing protein n=1 Tax=Mytilus coruscus TaxID=42192 RepID=A0A6J8EAW2_MYTCO|nr:unnamed protein product [Mytilus coruscus]
MFNLYNEVVAKKGGRRTAAINLSIQVALNHIAISTTGLQKLFLGSNIPAPSTSSMQHSANVVSEIIEEYNKKDLAQKRKLLKEINILRCDNPNNINMQHNWCKENLKNDVCAVLVLIYLFKMCSDRAEEWTHYDFQSYKRRVHTAIHNVNNGPGESIVKLCKAAWVPIEPRSRAARSLKNIQRHNEKHKLYKQSKRYTYQRCSKKHELYEIYEEKDYEKNKLLPTKRLAAKHPQELSFAKKTEIKTC